ncbi:MAG: hypothetical protein HYZ65_13230 [Burkholderiales bacterium]|nr:hypothetical protein [Burkholderiales bacterium]
MLDQPSKAELLRAVIEFIREQAIPELSGQTAFHARVASNALDIVLREIELAPAADAAELKRLRALFGGDGDLDELNLELCRRIEGGAFTLDTPGLSDHLWAVAVSKLAIDQPNYSTYRRIVESHKGVA